MNMLIALNIIAILISMINLNKTKTYIINTQSNVSIQNLISNYQEEIDFDEDSGNITTNVPYNRDIWIP